MSDHFTEVYLAACAYVGARITLEDQGGPSRLQEQIDADLLWHELAYAVLGECHYCDEGTCPCDQPPRYGLELWPTQVLVGSEYRPVENTRPL